MNKYEQDQMCNEAVAAQYEVEDLTELIDLNVFTYKDEDTVYGTKNAAEVIISQGYRKIPKEYVVIREEEYDIAIYDEYKLGFIDGSDKTAKEIITKLEQLQRCLKQVALNELIMSLEKQYGLVDLPVVDTPLICARCGKEIGTDDYFVKLRQSDPFNGHEECYWCEDCYDDFKKDLGE